VQRFIDIYLCDIAEALRKLSDGTRLSRLFLFQIQKASTTCLVHWERMRRHVGRMDRITKGGDHQKIVKDFGLSCD
jgi:hypothetical protein